MAKALQAGPLGHSEERERGSEGGNGSSVSEEMKGSQGGRGEGSGTQVRTKEGDVRK